jgi:hypothetical protein
MSGFLRFTWFGHNLFSSGRNDLAEAEGWFSRFLDAIRATLQAQLAEWQEARRSNSSDQEASSKAKDGDPDADAASVAEGSAAPAAQDGEGLTALREDIESELEAVFLELSTPSEKPGDSLGGEPEVTIDLGAIFSTAPEHEALLDLAIYLRLPDPSSLGWSGTGLPG